MTDTGTPLHGTGRPDPVAGTEFSLQLMLLESRDIAAFLDELAVLAAYRLSTPGNTIHAGVTVLRHKRPRAVAASDPHAMALDELQNGFGEGPCLTALRNRATLLVPDLAVERRWHPYVRTARQHGVASILAVPLDLAGEADAVLNLYSAHPGGFSSEDVSEAETFAVQAASSLRLAVRITQLIEVKSDLSATLESRTIIDMAVGAIMAENRCGRDTAVAILTRASNTRNAKLRDVAAAVIASISGETTISTYFDE
ncbi:GAF and ANTAR domain-containing protein [Paenarthrobacter sp. 22069]|uniref:GAF and ANTAR domain-containing protein n=1 Tax=Paenarthrobacter sp. 22069 TaxID=3453864 RepID=UPI003F87B22D